MLVTFHTKSYANITMFGDVAVKLLELMGHSGTVPSALSAEDVPAALERLKAAIAAEKKKPSAPPRGGEGRGSGEDENERPISLAKRALPMLELLESAAANHAAVMWD
jgi:hypothetical protein